MPDTDALSRIAAAVEDNARATREWLALNKESIAARTECDLTMAEFYGLQIVELRRKAIAAADDAEVRSLVVDALNLRRDHVRAALGSEG